MKKFALAAAAYLLPLAAFAAPSPDTETDNLADLFEQINAVINTLIPFLVGVAVLIIIWGVFNYISGAGDEEKRAQAKQYIIWGVIGVFIMLSVWGLVNVLVNSFDLKKTGFGLDQIGTKTPSFGGTGSDFLPPETEGISR